MKNKGKNKSESHHEEKTQILTFFYCVILNHWATLCIQVNEKLAGFKCNKHPVFNDYILIN